MPRRVFLDDSITGNDPSVNVAFDQALEVKNLGATVVVDPADLPSADEILDSNNEQFVLQTDFKVLSILFLTSFNPFKCLVQRFKLINIIRNCWRILLVFVVSLT